MDDWRAAALEEEEEEGAELCRREEVSAFGVDSIDLQRSELTFRLPSWLVGIEQNADPPATHDALARPSFIAELLSSAMVELKRDFTFLRIEGLACNSCTLFTASSSKAKGRCNRAGSRG